MKNIVFSACAIASLSLILSACSKKDDDHPLTEPGKVTIEFDHTVNGTDLILNNQWYKNENGDSFTVSKFNYYISNIILNGASGAFSETESYHLIQHEQSSSMSFDISNVPAGTYSSVSFMIGVDSVRNVSGAQTGALDPANGMFWSWNTGYIMLKLEGKSPVSPAPDNMFLFHCGGFSGNNNVLRTVTLNFPAPVEVDGAHHHPHLHIGADVAKMLKSPNVIDFSSIHTIHMPGANAVKLADNYANMFTLMHAGE